MVQKQNMPEKRFQGQETRLSYNSHGMKWYLPNYKPPTVLMHPVLSALQRAARDLLAPRIVSLLLWPMGVALLVWGLLAWWFGAAWKAEIADLLAATPMEALAQWAGAEWLIAYAAFAVLVLLWLPAVYITALLITSVAIMPIIVGFVEGREHPGLERRRGGSVVGSLVNAFVALAVYLAAWVLLLPLWLFAPFGMAVSVLLNAWVNQRLFLYDALAEHADAREIAQLRRTGGWPLYGLSALLGLLHFVPLLNIFAPIFMALAFTHYALDALKGARGTT